MRVVIQRIERSSVEVDSETVSSRSRGILVLVTFRADDTLEDLDWMARKCLELRIFEDGSGKMNLSVLDIQGEVMVVSQFTLYGDCRKGRRPDFTRSAPGPEAVGLYRNFIEMLESRYPRISEGDFGAHMKIEMICDGPVTIILDRETDQRGSGGERTRG